MTKNQLTTFLERVATWPDEDQEELADYAREIEARQRPYEASAADLRAIDEAREAVRRGEVATDEELAAVFAKHRRA